MESANVCFDISVSGSAEPGVRKGWYRPNSNLAGHDSLTVMTREPIARGWHDTIGTLRK